MTFENLGDYLNNSIFSAVSNEMFLAVIWALIASWVLKKRIIFGLYANHMKAPHGLIPRFFLFILDIILATIISFILVIVVVIVIWFIDGIFLK